MSINQNNEIDSFLKDLNKQQKKAVLDCDSSQLVLSGAGSGKTRVLTYKIAYLIKYKNIPPYKILALTFTNKAANEMKQRISKLIGEESIKHINMGTFHSIFCKILRTNITFLPDQKYTSNFVIIDEEDIKRILRDILDYQFEGIVQKMIEERGYNDAVKSNTFINELIKTIMDKIMNLKNRAITYEDYFTLSNEIENDKRNGIEFFKNIYEVYVKECQKKNVMDFEDLLLNTFILFSNKNNIKLLEKYQNKFDYILVDEYQDTNHVQFEILKALSWNHRRICAVGDDCQSIYAFRGADLKNFRYFKNNFKDAKQFKLSRNYRSASNIVKVADLLIKHNKNQIEKDLYSKKDNIDGKIKILINEHGFDEAEKVGFIIQDLVKNKKSNYKDIAILYRMNLQSFPFQKLFFRRNIPHKVCNRIGFFETKMIQNIFAYLKFLINPGLDICLNRIINYPPRKIGEKTQNKLFLLAKKNNISGWEIIKNCDNEEKIKEYAIDNELQKKLLPFKDLILYLMSMINNKRVYGIVYELIEKIKLKEYLKNDASSLEKIKMLLEKIQEMEEEYINIGLEKYTLDQFLEETSLLLGNEENYEKKNTENENKVKLMTIHQAKGLEFKYVFVVGLEEGFYPSSKSLSDDEIEEERRILYVAITRAKINCYISYAIKRMICEVNSKRTVSRFVEEINNKEFVDIYMPPLYQEYRQEKIIMDKKEQDNNNNNKNKIIEDNQNEEKIEKEKDKDKDKKSSEIKEREINSLKNKDKEKKQLKNIFKEKKVLDVKKSKEKYIKDIKKDENNSVINDNNFVCCNEENFIIINEDINIINNDDINNNKKEEKKKNNSKKKENIKSN